MTNRDQDAFPVVTFDTDGRVGVERAVQGLCARNQSWDSMRDLTDKAVEIADSLIESLNLPPR